MSHTYLKGKTKCLLCGEDSKNKYVNSLNATCEHKCKDRELQGDGRWVWCQKCKSYLEQPTPKGEK